MKQILIVAVVTLTIACKEKKHSTFVISGTIENAPGKKVMLMETPYASPQPVILDSAFLKEKGTFTLKGRANEEGIYRIIIENGPSVILVNDNEDINLHVDVNDYRNYTVKGSPASESLHDLFESYRTKDSAILSTFKQMESLRQLPGQDSATEVLKRKNDKQIDELNALLKNFIDNSESPAATFYALGMADQTMSKPEEIKLVNEAAKKFPEHAGLARIKKMMAVKPPPLPGKTEETVSAYPLLNKQAPDLTMNDVNDKPVRISSFQGKYLLIDFWASWCGPCRHENPNVVAAYNLFKNKNFTILGVSLDDNKSAWQKAIAADNLTWTHMSDLQKWESEAVKTYQFEGIPFNVLIDPSGKIIASGLTGEQLTEKLNRVLK